MKNARLPSGQTPKDAPGQLITFEEVRAYLMRRYLGNYADAIFQEMNAQLEAERRAGKIPDRIRALDVLRDLKDQKVEERGRDRAVRRDLRERAVREARHAEGHVLEEVANRDYQKEVLDRALDELPRLQRIVVNLRYSEGRGLSFKEIARIMGYCTSNARVLHDKAMAFIRAKFDGQTNMTLDYRGDEPDGSEDD